MKVVVLLLSLVCCVLAWNDVIAPTPPNITQQFMANFTLGEYNGFIAVDYIHGGGFFNLKGDGGFPVYIDTKFIASPDDDNNTITLFWYYGSSCLNTGVWDLDDITLFPLAIPPGSVYKGTAIVDNQNCTVWKYDSEKFGATVTMWVNEKLSSPVRIELADDGYAVNWRFKDTVIGPFSPSIYELPAGMNCPPIDWFGLKSLSRMLKILKW